MTKNTVLGYLTLTFFLILLSYGWYSNYLVQTKGITTKAIAIEAGGYRIRRFEKNWSLLYVVNEKPYYTTLTEPGIRRGDNYEVVYNPENIERSIVKDKINGTDSILVYGDNFPKTIKQEITFYYNNQSKSAVFEESFAHFIPNCSKLTIGYK